MPLTFRHFCSCGHESILSSPNMNLRCRNCNAFMTLDWKWNPIEEQDERRALAKSIENS